MATSLGNNSRVKPNLALFNFLCYNLLNKNKNERWKYVYICFLTSSLSFLREWWDKSYTRAWVKYKIGRWYNHCPRPRVLFGFGTCDKPTQWRDLGNILLSTWVLMFGILFSSNRRSWEPLATFNPSWPFRT